MEELIVAFPSIPDLSISLANENRDWHLVQY